MACHGLVAPMTSFLRVETTSSNVGDSIDLLRVRYCALEKGRSLSYCYKYTHDSELYESENACRSFFSESQKDGDCYPVTSSSIFGIYTKNFNDFVNGDPDYFSKHNYFLKHDVENNIITASSLCFNKDSSMICLTGDYEHDVSLLDEVFNEDECSTDDYGYVCNYNSLSIRVWLPEKNVSTVQINSGYLIFCRLLADGSSNCN